MTDHEYYEQLVSSSIDGTLTDTEREKLEAHLAECPSCAALREDLQQMQALFAAETELPDGLHDDIMQRVREQKHIRVVQPQETAMHRRLLPAAAMVAAAAVVVLVVLGGGLGDMINLVSRDTGASSASVDMAADASSQAVQDVQNNAAAGSVPDHEAVQAAGEADTAAAPQNGAPAEEQYALQQTADEPSSPADSMPRMAQWESGDAASGKNDITYDTASVRKLPESVCNLRFAHCYLAWGSDAALNVDGELLLNEDGACYFVLENSMSVLENTLADVERAGYTVSAYEDVGLTIDSKAESWLLIVAEQ